MEPLFVNKYTLSRDDVKTHLWYAGRFLPHILIRCFGCALCAAAFFAFSRDELFLFAAVLFAGAALGMAARYSSSVRFNWNVVCEVANGGPTDMKFSFYDEYFVRTNSANEDARIFYAHLKSARTVKHLIVLTTKAGLTYLLRRDAFTVGSESEFIEFINRKIALNGLPAAGEGA